MIMHKSILIILLAYMLPDCYKNVNAADLDEWRSRTVYQVFTDRFATTGKQSPDCNVSAASYCGGTWSGIKSRLDYIAGMHFDAIWISPVVAQLPQTTTDGEAYAGYWQHDLYRLTPNFGEQQELIDLIEACHARNILVMLDVVVNHFGWAGNWSSVDYSVFVPFDDKRYFHDYCALKQPANETNVERCWLGDDVVPLPDLRTEDVDVQRMFAAWITYMVGTYKIDGLRIDTALHVQKDFFPDFVKASGIFATGETFTPNATEVCRWADAVGSMLNYPLYFSLVRAFESPQGNISDLIRVTNEIEVSCRDSTVNGVFSENHDVIRIASLANDISLALNILVYTIIGGNGIPFIYQGQEQHVQGTMLSSSNRTPLWTTKYNTSAPLYAYVAILVRARKTFIAKTRQYVTGPGEVMYKDQNTFVVRKGQIDQHVIVMMTNVGQDRGDHRITITASLYAPDTRLRDVLSCRTVIVDSFGGLDLMVSQGRPQVIYPEDLLIDSDLCNDEASMHSTTTSSTMAPTSNPTTTALAAPSMTAVAGISSSPSWLGICVTCVILAVCF